MFSILLVLLIIVAVLMIGIILLQKSEGSGMSGSSAASMFGGALTGAAAGNFLTRATAWLATIFFVLCAALALIASKTDMGNQQSDLRQEIVQQDAVAPVADPAPAENTQTTESK
ncbi:MAG: preprotein translocase subunit SecG [Alphaproteobacteria bacterium]|nr:preprotein translocase subunit SecG [Alphaproteobacteria bacterium]